MTIAQTLFWIFAFLTCGSAVAVVLVENVVRMAFWLVISLCSMAGLFLVLHADFLAASQLLIYAGGTVVILIFGVMLTANSPLNSLRTPATERFAGYGMGALLTAALVGTIASVPWQAVNEKTGVSPAQADLAAFQRRDLHSLQQKGAAQQQAARKPAVRFGEQAEQGRSTAALGMALLGLRPDRDLGVSKPDRKLSPGYLLPFEIISVHLLIVLIAAGYLARAKQRRPEIRENSSTVVDKAAQSGDLT